MRGEKPIEHKERAHALLSASGASRWTRCESSALLEEKFPEETSEYAAEGTLAHELSELYLLKDFKKINHGEYAKRTADWLLHNKSGYNPKIVPFVLRYTSYVMETFNLVKKKDKNAVIFIEVRVDFSRYVPGGFGTSDVIIIGAGEIHVIDLKFGEGLVVSAIDNPQLKIYALGAIEEYELMYDIEQAHMHIVQPRLDEISTWDTSATELIDWGEGFLAEKAALALASEFEGDQAIGSWCQFCKAKHRCAAYAKEIKAVEAHEFADPRLLTDTQLLEIFHKASLLTKWLNGLSDYMTQEAKAGRKWEGLKLVEGRSARQISDLAKAEQLLYAENFTEEDIYTKEMISMTVLEKLLGKKQFAATLGSLITKTAGKPTLVAADDKRPEFNPAADFDDDWEDSGFDDDFDDDISEFM